MKKRILFFAILQSIASVAFAQTYAMVFTYTGTTTAGYVDGPLNSALFDRPYNLCTDPVSGTVYVSDTYNHCIRKISAGMVTTLAGNGSSGDVDAQGTNARFNAPAGLCFYNGDVYVTDNGNNKIKKIDSLGNVTTIAGTGTPGFLDGNAAQAQFYNPFDVKVDNAGDLYIADYYNHCIRKIAGGMVTTIAGVGGVSGDSLGVATSAKFNRPRSICFDGLGNLYIADMLNHKIKMLTTSGTVVAIAGSGSVGSQDGTGTGAGFNQPLGVDMDMFGNVLITDGQNHKIRRTTPGGTVSTIAGTGTSGYLDGSASSAMFYVPAGIGLINGKIYICDVFNNCIRYLDHADLSVQEIPAAPALTIFPNPSLDYVTIKSSFSEGDYFETISIFNTVGELVKEIRISSQAAETNLYIGDLAPGTYTIRALSKEGKSGSSTIIRN